MEESLKKSLTFQEEIRSAFELSKTDPALLSPLVLAYVGDCAYEMVIRVLVLKDGNTSVNKLNAKASQLVKASAQAAIAYAIADELKEEEAAVYKRGRNAKSCTKAKNATTSDYRHATGLEALCGYLYLKQSYSRLLFLLKNGMERAGLL